MGLSILRLLSRICLFMFSLWVDLTDLMYLVVFGLFIFLLECFDKSRKAEFQIYLH